MKLIFIISISLMGFYAMPQKLLENDSVWTLPYRVSEKYPQYFENSEGKHLYVLNKTAWAYFACEYPEKVLENTKKHGANVIRVCLEGVPYSKTLKYDLWPWGGTRSEPDFSTFKQAYWDIVEKRIELAAAAGIGIDLVLYFSLKPQMADSTIQRAYLDYAIERLGKYNNLFAWEIIKGEISSEGKKFSRTL